MNTVAATWMDESGQQYQQCETLYNAVASLVGLLIFTFVNENQW